MANLQQNLSSLSNLTKYINDFKTNIRPIKVIKLSNMKMLALDSDSSSGSFVVITLASSKLQCRISYKTVFDSQTLNIYKSPSNLARVLSSQGWIKSKDNYSFYKSDPQLYTTIYAKYFKNVDIDDVLLKAYTESNNVYHNGSKESFLTDEQFDWLKTYLKEKNLVKTDEVGANPTSNLRKTTLPYIMPSLEDTKSSQALNIWVKKHNITQLLKTPKIDGTSVLLVYKQGKLTQAFTRGNGTVGNIILHNIKHVKNIPQQLKQPVDIALRGEAYLEESVFKSKYIKGGANLYQFKTARNATSGMMNRKTPETTVLSDVKFQVFEVLSKYDYDTKSSSLDYAKSLGLPVVNYSLIKSGSDLDKLLERDRKNNDFLMDGLVLEENNISKRAKLGVETGSINPKYARSYKPNSGQAFQTTVTSVTTNISKDGFAKPTVNFEPIEIGGVEVSKATAFNYGYIRDNKIGPGSVILIKRSGDTIPHIEEIVKSTKAQLPVDVDKYEWNSTNVDLVLKSEHHAASDEVKIQKIIQFFNTCNIENFSEGIIRQFYSNGFTTVKAIIAEIYGYNSLKSPSKSQANWLKELKKLENPGVTLPQLMYGSGCFGRGLGIDKLQKIYDEYGEDCVDGWVDFSLGEIASSIDKIKGFSVETGKQFAAGIKPFIKFRNSLKGLVTIKQVNKTGILSGQLICFTGFRDKQLAQKIADQGGKTTDSLSRQVNVLLIPNKSFTSEKTKKANDYGIPLMTSDEFVSKYKI